MSNVGRARLLVLAPVVATGCGRLDFAPLGDAADAGTGCWPAWRAGTIDFSPPAQITELASTAPTAALPTLSSDGLTLYFAENGDLHQATRSARGMPWQNITPITELNTPQNEHKLSVSPDGQLAVWASARSGRIELWAATRASATGPFSGISTTLVDPIDAFSNTSINDPNLPSGQLDVFHTVLTGGNQHIYVATRATASVPFGAPIALTELAVGAGQQDPAVSPDELVIVFSVVPTSGPTSIYYAVRGDRTAPFGQIAELTALHEPTANDGDVAIASDGCEVLFASDRAGTSAIYSTLVR